MKTILTEHPDFTIEEDTYPFTESKKIISGLNWFDHPARIKDPNISNYSLDVTIPGSLGDSFETKLKDIGVLHFLKHKGEIICFSGMYLEKDTNIARGSHRMLTNPNMDRNAIGAHTTYIIAEQVKLAREWKAEVYAVNVNKKNLKIFNFTKRGRGVTDSRQEAYDKVGHKFSISDEPIILNNVEQWVATISLYD